MGFSDVLSVGANIASIGTAGVAIWAAAKYHNRQARRRETLEDHLRREKMAGNDRGQRTLKHLVRELGMSETDILEIAAESKKIGRRVDTDDSGRASSLFLVYEPDV